jgi:hypothetical protein
MPRHTILLYKQQVTDPCLPMTSCRSMTWHTDLVATNGGLSEQVSTFTYYCHTAMYANAGGQIRALNCSSAHGDFGLVAEGSNPNEKIDAITLSDNMTQSGIVFNDGSVNLLNRYWVQQYIFMI